jgi:hypothetical protein
MRGALIGERFGETACGTRGPLDRLSAVCPDFSDFSNQKFRTSEPTIAKLTGVQEANYR